MSSWIEQGRARDEAAAEQAFADGDYTRAALLADSDEVRGCALVLLGNHEQGLPLLERIATPRASFFAAFAHWGLRQKWEALQRLVHVGPDPVWGPAAKHLAELMRKPKLRILLQGRDDPSCRDYDIVGAFRGLPEVDLKTVGYSSTCDVVMDHTTTYEEMMAKLPEGWQPDLFLSHIVEDNPPPIGIENAPFPTLCHSQDYDRHFHHCGHYLRLFDAAVVLGSADHQDFCRLTGSRAFVFPKLLGVSSAGEYRGRESRPVDVFISGTLFNNTRQKSRYIFDISQLPEHYRVELLDGYCTTDDYYSRLAQAKVTFTYVNRWGLINGRAIEAISQGACAVYQEGGELGLFLSESEGAVPYQPHNVLETVRRVVDQWDEKYRACGLRGSARVRDVFDIDACMRRYFHFLAFCLTQKFQKPRRETHPEFSQLRPPNRSPWRIFPAFDQSVPKVVQLHEGFRSRWSGDESYARLDACGESSLYSYILETRHPLAGAPPGPGEPGKVSAWRKLVLAAKKVRGVVPVYRWLRRSLQRFRRQSVPPESLSRRALLLQDAIQTYERLLQHYPDRLAPRFNLARLLFESGDLASAEAHFATVRDDLSLWYESSDLLFWREFQDFAFDYELMMTELVSHGMDGDPSHLRRIERAIRESAVFYGGEITLRTRGSSAARDFLKRTVSGSAELPALWLLQAQVCAECGDHDSAARSLAAAVEIEPSFVARVPDALIGNIQEHTGTLSLLQQQRQRLFARKVA